MAVRVPPIPCLQTMCPRYHDCPFGLDNRKCRESDMAVCDELESID